MNRTSPTRLTDTAAARPFDERLLDALRALQSGERELPALPELEGAWGELAREIRQLSDAHRLWAAELERVRACVEAGDPAARLTVPATEGVWAESARAINRLLDGLRPTAAESAQALSRETAAPRTPSAQRTQLMAHMGHALRTPLNSVIVLSKMLADNLERNLSEKQIAFAETIHESGNALLSRINALLDLSKIDAGTLRIEPSDVLLADLAAVLRQKYARVARDKQVEFSVELAPDLPEVISSDSKRLQQILVSLLSNAFKFTERGAVRVNVGLASRGFSPDHPVLRHAPSVVEFAVTDTGTGMAEDLQHGLFGRAPTPMDGGLGRRSGGSGLGLTVSRELARLLGGELCVHSEPGQGSTFSLYLPLGVAPLEATAVRLRAAPGSDGSVAATAAPAHAPAQAAPLLAPDGDGTAAGPSSNAEGRGVSGRGTRLLIIDRDVRKVFALTSALERRGVRVQYAESGRDCLALLSREPAPDVVLVDEATLDESTSSLEALRERAQRGVFRLLVIPTARGGGARGAPSEPVQYLEAPVDIERVLAVLRAPGGSQSTGHG